MNLHIDKRADALIPAVGEDDDQLLKTPEAAKLLGVSVQWLEIGRSKGFGPPFIRMGARFVRYRKDSLRAWLKERAEHRCTSEYGEVA
jgi:predicted DNA-binding transcriptional regulator AlpA